MVRGTKPKKSDNLREERVTTWRHDAKVHNAMIDHCASHGISTNYFITKAVSAILFPPKPPVPTPKEPEDSPLL